MPDQRFFTGLLVVGLSLGWAAWAPRAAALDNFELLAGTDEQIRWSRLPDGVRVFVDAPRKLNAARRTLVIYATPNGNTIEQTLGCEPAAGLDFRFDIQHVVAQVRCWRQTLADQDVVLCVVQAPGLSWPTFRKNQAGTEKIIRELVASLATEFKADQLILAGHSGGGSFLLGYISSVDVIPTLIQRIVFLDANYSYSDDQHAEKLLNWLRGSPSHHLIVIAYDDRNIELNGKKVIGPDGGTFRATQRMHRRFKAEMDLTEQQTGPFQSTTGLNGQVQWLVHPNSDNKILHTALVGEMNGLLQGLSVKTDHATAWGTFGGPRAYTKWIPAKPIVESKSRRASLVGHAEGYSLKIPKRPDDAPTGSQFQKQIVNVSRQDREAAVAQEVLCGNIPDFLRRLMAIRTAFTDAAGASHTADYFVMPDYLAIGTDADFFRMPMTPRTASAIADSFGASLITTKISDDIDATAAVRLEPKPLMMDRDQVATFFQHHQIIQSQLREQPSGSFVAGIKKDVVLTNRLKEKPHRVAIFGWHQLNGIPIQPLYVGHVDWYVDYSHGVRLMAARLIVDGSEMSVADVLNHLTLNKLLSDEGPIDLGALKKSADW